MVFWSRREDSNLDPSVPNRVLWWNLSTNFEALVILGTVGQLNRLSDRLFALPKRVQIRGRPVSDYRTDVGLVPPPT